MEGRRRLAVGYVIKGILSGRADVEGLKREACRRFRPDSILTNPELLAALPKRATMRMRALLLKKPARTLSGVTPVAVMIRPEGSCTHNCIYCPAAGLAAKSYTGYEPAALRGRQSGFDPRLQAMGRVEQFEGGGHPADKCEVIVMGGTFLETPKPYRVSFIKGVYEGLNGRKAKTLAGAIRANERAGHRAVGLTLETRPDVCIRHIGEMLSYGATRVELGVQHADDAIYRLVKRGHTVEDVADATRALKNAAFKVLYHIMPGMPGSNRKKDISFVRRLFSDARFRPDMLKIYPTLVIPGTGLAEMEARGAFRPYDAEEAADVISEFYRHIPPYVRVMRIQRDIPAARIRSGVKKSNLRELVDAKLREKGIIASEIRSREIGLQGGQGRFAPGDFAMRRIAYDASGGTENFLSYEDEAGLIAGFIRLRFQRESGRMEITPDAALVRELHVYGSEVPLGGGRAAVQHRGIGAKLLEEAEALASEAGKGRMIVISGIGARGYYRKRGYSLLGPYMHKRL
ncbi:MAG: tRNA uridine(34) 5-carboxymethylaminomethyl modification radical SAM/GNAT enzyme Elp3 [Candidatus ainarchaeum sp.]|nr:tRNA uridine(34) 5-carboxymethylaminomethyl modification radical SAM/GNAT enzyme Elp3 [Candidatus ainarchaeum sp.]